MKATAAVERRAKARGEMREVILETARNIVAAEGVQALSIRAIARTIGYSPAALYEYFPGIGDIYHSLYLEGAGGLADRMKASLASVPAEATPEERMYALGQSYREYALEQPELYKLAWVGEFPAPTEDVETQNEAFMLLIDAAREGVDQGRFIDLPAEAIALACWATLHGIVMLEIHGFIEHKLGTEKEGTVRFFDLFASTMTVLGTGFMRR